STPWGETSQSEGGYHLVWSRDLTETTTALVALELYEDARNVLCYLIAAQQKNGCWLQNLWLGGQPFWQGIQLDETAFPVLLAASLYQLNQLNNIPVKDMVKKALSFIVKFGPSTDQDRWEEDAGINTFTLAVAIAALVEGSIFLDDKEKKCALMLADYWNMRLEDWTFAYNTDLSKELNVKGYYMRIAPKDVMVHQGAKAEHIFIKNRTKDPNLPAMDQIATDFLQLCRYGLRDPKDFHITESIKAIDKILKIDTPSGPVWHRYNGDGYGEHSDGSAFDGSGIGRGWPLLVGERGHYAILNGENPMLYINTMVNMCGLGGLLPEQVWDSDPIPEKELYPGKPSGSAMPLVWAHAEFIKLCLSTIKGYPVDRPINTYKRYKAKKPILDYYIWKLNHGFKYLPQGKDIYFFFDKKVTIHWGINNWQNV
ncbi:MAG: glycoside hydrolase family 15 protein, partial [Nitrososphaeria archaeon]